MAEQADKLDWRKLDTSALVGNSYAEKLAAIGDGTLSTDDASQRARFEALTAANNKKYGPESNYTQHRLNFHPIKSPRFQEALDRVGLRAGATIVDMGVNDGYEIGAIANRSGRDFLDQVTMWGIDISDAAIIKAREAYPENNFHFLHGNGEILEGVDAKGAHVRVPDKSADLYISINSFQSTGLDKGVACTNAIRVLKDSGSMVLVIPPFHDPRTGKENYEAKMAAVSEIRELLAERGLTVETLGERERYTFILGLRSGKRAD